MPADILLIRREAVEAVEARQARKAREFAAEARELAALAEAFGGHRDGVLELSGTARMGQDRSSGELTRATRLVDLFPAALGLLEQGVMFVATAHLLLAVTKNASSRVQAAVDRRISAEVAELDAADARHRIATTLVEVESELELELEEAKRRHAQAKADRGVWVMPVEDGMARIGAQVDALDAQRFRLDLAALVRAEKVVDDRDGVTRTKAQREADVLVELPTRYLALVRALREGRSDELLARARAGWQDDAKDNGKPLSATSPDREPAGRAWDLALDELVAQLLRLPVRRPATLNVHVPMSTMLDLDDQAAWIDGLGPLPAWRARLLLPVAGLRRVMVSPKTGLPFHVDEDVHPPVEIDIGRVHRRPPDEGPDPDDSPGDSPGDGPDNGPDNGPDDGPDDGLRAAAATDDGRLDEVQAEVQRLRLLRLLAPANFLPRNEPQYAPSAGLRRLVQVRDLRCLGPGCSRTAHACDLDHEVEAAEGGETAEWNLSAKSRRCHLARHEGWTVHRDRQSGVTTWTSPLGRSYSRLPAWRPHPPLPEDLVLPPPRLEQLPSVARSRPEDPTHEGEVDSAEKTQTPPPSGALAKTSPQPLSPRSTESCDGRGWDNGAPPAF